MDDKELMNEVLELTLACQCGDATAEERARLERLLADDPRAIQWYLRVVDDSLTLLDAAAANDNVSSAIAEPAKVLAAELATPLTKNNALRSRGGHRPRWSLAIAVVACVLLAAFAALERRSRVAPGRADFADRNNGRLARVVDVSGVAWADGAKQFSEWSLVRAGDTLKFRSGWINLFLENGAELLIEGPADVKFVSLNRVFAAQGKLAARIGPGAVGFRIDTPHANVTDRGTAFGVSVDGDSHTSVVVYEGIVDLDVVGDRKLPRRRMESGEALSVNRQGKLSRITTVESEEFLEPPKVRVGGNQPSRLIASVSDNVRSLQTAKYYRVIPGGFQEDCRAYVDRLHEWNGVDGRGLPPFLAGGDYVMTFNDDKVATKINIAVTLARPANVYVLVDDRVPPADWLKRDFVDTGWDVGADEGYEGRDIQTVNGPGNSIDHVYSVWRRNASHLDTIVLGALSEEESTKPARDVERSMYGVVVTPLGDY
jgi:hypothetical protein